VRRVTHVFTSRSSAHQENGYDKRRHQLQRGFGLLDASGTPLSMTSYAQFVDAQGGSADPIKDGKEEDNKEYEEEEETEEANTPFGKA
jgi:hypothetical protein